MKKCPFWAESIQEDATKCRFCGEWLNKKPISDKLTEAIKNDIKRAHKPTSYPPRPNSNSWKEHHGVAIRTVRRSNRIHNILLTCGGGHHGRRIQPKRPPFPSSSVCLRRRMAGESIARSHRGQIEVSK